MSGKLRKRTIALAATLAVVIMASIFIYGTYGQAKTEYPPSVEQARIYLDYNEFVTMPRTTVYAELDCVGSYVDSGNWTGVRLGFVLEKAGLTQQADVVELYASDGYSTKIAYSVAMRENVIIAYEKDGSTLPEVTRLVVPNANGDEWISNIARIKVVFSSGSYASIYLK
jgi:DMSO/TMAO reductase YedYZ molybdopterin-dependent catalytic subunit